jgi:hypothetical protein
MDVCLLWLYAVLSCVSKGLCDGLITRWEEFYRVSVCVWSRNHKKGGQRSILGYKRLWISRLLNDNFVSKVINDTNCLDSFLSKQIFKLKLNWKVTERKLYTYTAWNILRKVLWWEIYTLLFWGLWNCYHPVFIIDYRYVSTINYWYIESKCIDMPWSIHRKYFDISRDIKKEDLVISIYVAQFIQIKIDWGISM